jgi:hypothetical protein
MTSDGGFDARNDRQACLITRALGGGAFLNPYATTFAPIGHRAANLRYLSHPSYGFPAPITPTSSNLTAPAVTPTGAHVYG